MATFAQLVLIAFTIVATTRVASAEAPTSIDLDGDGTAETRLSIEPCQSGGSLDCLAIEGPSGRAEVRLSISAATRDPSSTDFHLQGPHIIVIGNHGGGPAPEVAVLTGERDAKLYHGLLSVVDVQGRRVLGRAQSPVGLFNVFVDAARGPDGRRHPFLAPSFGASPKPAPELGTAGAWDFMCTFTPGADDPRCGSGFSSIDIGASRTDDGRSDEYYFREAGGYLQDLDGDGWEDVNLVYHFHLRTISLVKRKVLAIVRYDIAQDKATLNRDQFPNVTHSGRNFGTHAAVRTPDRVLRDVMVGGVPVDSFGKDEPTDPRKPRAFHDLYCNVTRFIGVVEARSGQPESRHLSWARYFGFDSSGFVTMPKEGATGPSILAVPAFKRRGDFMNRCIHRFSDSRLQLEGRDLIAIDVFEAGEPQSSCESEQYQLYFDGWSKSFTPPKDATAADAKPWSAVKERAWNGCKAQNIGKKGRWTLQLYDEASGAPAGTLADGYVWGWSDRIVPGATVALVENAGGETPFDFTWDLAQDRPRPPARLQVRVVAANGWRQTWTLPAGRPRIVKQPPRGPRGIGDYSYYAELSTADVDGDGLLDVQLVDGSWIGFARASKSFVCKQGCAGKAEPRP